MHNLEWKYSDGQIELQNEHGKTVADIKFVQADDNTMDIVHTWVSPELQGKGIASELVEAAVHDIKELGMKPTASCGYAAAWLKRHKI